MSESSEREPVTVRYEVVFALPLLVPFPDDYSVRQYEHEDEPDVLSLRFRWGEASDSRTFGAITAAMRETWGTEIGESGPHDAFRDRITVVIGSTVARPLRLDAPHEELGDPYFARILRQTDDIVQAYGLLMHQPVPRLGPTTIFPGMVQRWVREDETATEPTVVVLDTEKTAMERVERLLPLSQERLNELAKIGGRLDSVRAGRPFYTSVKLFAAAERALNAREPEAAVVEAASAIESMGWEILHSLAEEDGQSVPNAKTTFGNVLKDHLLRRLQVPAQDPIVEAWVRDGYEVRHRVVHDGAEATLAVALTAARAAEALSARLDEALVDLVRRYPRTAARKLGQPLLERAPGEPGLREIVEAESTSPIKVGVVQAE
jgi:hypothetical protein